MRDCLVREYDPEWPKWFKIIRAHLEPALSGLPCRIEHVGSTSIPGMTAKPIIDLVIIVERSLFLSVRDRLAAIGYRHEGDGGIQDREAFDLNGERKEIGLPPHHLYVCIVGADALQEHLAFRDFMRQHPEWIARLSDHKRALCAQYDNDRQAYMLGKAEMVKLITDLAIRNSEPGNPRYRKPGVGYRITTEFGNGFPQRDR